MSLAGTGRARAGLLSRLSYGVPPSTVQRDDADHRYAGPGNITVAEGPKPSPASPAPGGAPRPQSR